VHGGILINPVPCLSARVLGAKGEDHEVLHLTGEVVDVPQCDEWVIAAEWRPIMVVILDAQPGATTNRSALRAWSQPHKSSSDSSLRFSEARTEVIVARRRVRSSSPARIW
jgi:hypothetical protein